MNRLFEIIHEDCDLLVVNKPAGLVCHPTKGDEYSSLISRARLYLGFNAQPHLINRLDRETSGVTLIAKNNETAWALREPWEKREVKKLYLAIVHGHVAPDSGVIDAPLGRDQRSEVAIKDCVVRGGAVARTNFRVTRRFTREEGAFSVLQVQPLTGRKHQIRIHLAHFGHPLVGDKLYGPDERLYLEFVNFRLTEEQRRQLILPYHALHAASVEIRWRGELREWSADAEDWFLNFAELNRIKKVTDFS